MSKYQVSFEKIQFVNESNDWLFRFIYQLSIWLSIITKTTISPRVILKGKNKWIHFSGLKILGDALGFSDETSQNILSIHEQRIRKYIASTSVSLILLAISSFPLFDLFTDFLLFGFTFFPPLSLYLFVTTIFTVVVLVTFVKFVLFVLERYFADTLCVLSSFAILFELVPDDVLSDPNKKRILLRYINDLVRNTSLLSSVFVADSIKRINVRGHFQSMEEYIRERETNIVLTKDDTLKSLRKDFYSLTAIYINENYGKFEGFGKPRAELISETKTSWTQKILLGATRIAGIITPVAIWFFLVNNPAIAAKIGIDNSILTLILLAWFLVFLDSTLKLGIISTVISVFKEFRDIK